jgi:DNA-binding NarL/FixJ family response regulator
MRARHLAALLRLHSYRGIFTGFSCFGPEWGLNSNARFAVIIDIWVHRSEVLANLTEAVRALFRIVEHGALAEILAYSPRPGRPVSGANRRLSAAEIDQLVEDYRSGVGSIYDLAYIYGVHRNTVAVHLKGRGVLLGHQPLNEREADRAIALRKEGLSFNAIGRALGRDPKTVKAVVSSD